MDLLPAVIKYLHYRTDAEGLVVVIDSDDTPGHSIEHESEGGGDTGCRLCGMRAIARKTLATLTAGTGRIPLQIAIGVAVPALEAWLLAPGVPHATEAIAAQSHREGRGGAHARRRLKVSLYGTDRPSQTLERDVMVRAAREIVGRGDVRRLEKVFPVGFGALARGLREWRAESSGR